MVRVRAILVFSLAAIESAECGLTPPAPDDGAAENGELIRVKRGKRHLDECAREDSAEFRRR